MKNNNNSNGDQEQLNEWSRHFESISWTMSGILFGAIGALGIYLIEHFNFWLCLSGLLITLIVSFLIASFRATRKQIHASLNPNVVNLILTPKGFKQWPVYLLLLFLINTLWVVLLIVNKSKLTLLWILLGFISMFFAGYWFNKSGKTPSNSKK